MTPAHQAVLDRELRKAELKPIIDELHPILVEMVDEGTWMIREAFERYDGQRQNLAIPFLCHSQLEMLDALAPLCKEAICRPSNLQCRSIFESHFFCRFLDQSPPDRFRLLAMSYVYEFHRQFMEMGKKLDEMKGQDVGWIEENIQKLSDAGFREIVEEHKRMQAKRNHRYYKWFSLFDGPSSLNNLIKIVLAHVTEPDGGADANSFLYGMHSQTMHANDLFARMSSSRDGKAEIHSFRTFESIGDFLNGYGYAARMAAFSIGILLKRNCGNGKNRMFDFWIKNFQPRLRKLERFRPKDTPKDPDPDARSPEGEQTMESGSM